MTFLHSWALWIALPAVALPALIHLLTRPRPVRMPLSTIRFLRDAIQQRRARHWLRDFLILALRTTAVLLLILAFARPQASDQPADVGADAETVRVVVFDVSQSMAATQRGIPAIERARAIAARVLRYHPRLRANLLLAGASVEGVFEQPSSNFEVLHEALNQCHVRPEQLNARFALERAARMLTPSSEKDKRRFELIVLSDFQRSNWSDADFSILPASTQIQLESIASPELANLAVLHVEAHRPHLGSRGIELAVDVGNFTPVPKQVDVDVQLGGKTLTLVANCPAMGQVTVVEEIADVPEGWLRGEARLVGAEDALPADDTRYFVLQVKPKPTYALVTRESPTLRPSSSYFLQCALAPDAAAAQVERINPEQPSRRNLASSSLVIIDHPGKLSAEATGLLAGLIRRGRPLIYVAAEPVDATNLKQLSDAAGTGLQLPVQFVPPPAMDARRNLFLTTIRHDLPPFNVFGDQLSAIAKRLRFAGGLGAVRLEQGLADDVLATFGDGTPLLVMVASDAGSLAVINADLAASTLPRTPAFVPFMDELIGRMVNHDDGSEAYCGESLVAHLAADLAVGQKLSLGRLRDSEPPSATNDSEQRYGRLTEDQAGVLWQWSSPGPPGVYAVRNDDKTAYAVAVNIPSEESELESLSGKVLKERLAGGRHVYYRDATIGGNQRDETWSKLLTGCVTCLLASIGVMLIFRS